MKIHRNWLGLVCLLANCVAPAQSRQQQPVSPIEILAVRSNSVDIKFRSVWPYSVSLSVCDTPQRLNELGYYLEGYIGQKWKRLKPREGHILGDLKPEYLEIGEGRTDRLPANISPVAFGAKTGMKLRIVVRAWRTEHNVLDIAVPVSGEPLLLTSASFVLQPEPANSEK